MSDQEHTTPNDPKQMAKIRLLFLRLRNNWFFLKQCTRNSWWPNKIRQYDRERKDWQRWCRDAERRLNEALATKPDCVTGCIVHKTCREMRDCDPLDVLARWALRNAVTAWTEESWGEHLPDIGEYDYYRICDRMMGLLPDDVTQDEFEVAFEEVAARAESVE